MFGLIAGAISAVCSAVGAITMAISAIKVIAQAIHSIAKALGLVKPEEEVEDLGDKALQADEAGIKPENYDKYAEYVKAVEDFEIDPEKSKNFTTKQKQSKGMELSACAMQEKLGVQVPVDALVTLAMKKPEMFTPGRFTELGNIVKETPETVKLLVNCLNGSDKSLASVGKAIQVLANMEKAENTQLTDVQAQRNARGMLR